MKTALRYYGGKWKLAPWIISYFPAHLNYLEPCGGGASVLLQKPPAKLETYNDLDGAVVNFFRVLRDQPDALIEKIELTPWARAEYAACREPAEDTVEAARRFYVMSVMSFNGATGDNPRTFGWRCSTDHRLRSTPTREITQHSLRQIARRLQSVQIENQDYRQVIERFGSDQTLIYLDPPYLAELRTNDDWYAHEWSERDHVEAAEVLHGVAGQVIISGYASALYADLYENRGWTRVDRLALNNSGNQRVESL